MATLDNSSHRAVTVPTCPHLGLRDEPGGYYSYPSTYNRCYHCKLPATPSLARQEAYCLNGGQKHCRVYWQSWKKAFPSSLQEVEAVHPGRSAVLRTVLVVAVGLMAIGYTAFRLIPKVFSLSAADPSPPAAATIAPSVTPPPTATSSPVPTSTRIPTSTPLPQTHRLEVPFEIDGHKLLMHRVGAGDTFETIEADYDTTREVIRSLNYHVVARLPAKAVIVIAPGLRGVDPALPRFKVFQVLASSTTIDEIASQYDAEPLLTRRYNGCATACRLLVGDWVIVPVAK